MVAKCGLAWPGYPADSDSDMTRQGKPWFWRLVKSPLFWTALVFAGLSACSFTLGFEDFAGDETIKRESITVQTDRRDYRLSLLRAGDPSGQRVIFIHGTPGNASGWQRYLEAVPVGLHYIAIDRPGFGLTSPKKEQVSLDEQAAVIEPLLEAHNGRYPILVGHSLGGPIAAAVAANYPGRVDAVIQLAASVDPALEKIRVIQYIGEIPPIVWLIPKALVHTNREVFALKKELLALGEKLDQLTASVIIIHGTRDKLVPYDNVHYMLKKFTGAAHLELVTLEGQNHFLPWNSYDILNQKILRIVKNFPGDPLPKTVLDVNN